MRSLAVNVVALIAGMLCLTADALANDRAGSRLLATSGATTVEGTAGGGLTPWAMLAGYGDHDEFGCAAAYGNASTDDYALQTISAACTYDNRIELSFSRQALDLDGLIPLLGLPANQQLRQNVFGAKMRLFGDIVYAPFGQLSAGVTLKDNDDKALVRATGATRTRDTEFYVTGGKLFIDGPFGQMAFLNVGARWTRANQTGLLGFGGDRERSRGVHGEIAAAIFPRRDFAVGFEYRQKPDNLSFAGEQNWRDVFVAWFPNKYASVVVAWVDLGSIGTLSDQQGLYASFAGTF